ncbi:amino acid ABC transporter permease [Campylobacter volucris]|uniref:amino acid ABC transporter permease n=1 Tax=Campylobacter volucris TaxID=1031542 RepID=UPI0018A09E3E|nr:amino acid ABC transporter permease [Campylobacter volucris]MBF7048514.1 amino acid ABC transporter permease [Campylobacter volucris]MBF7059483.1 amino acid ABC transporter permease [Campylobacter volucris]
MFEILNQDTLTRIFEGLKVTLELSFISVLISLVGGVFFGILMNSKNKIIYSFCRFMLEFVRIMPLLVWLFMVHFGLAKWLGWHLDALTSSIIVFSIWGIFEMMDLVRASLTSIPKHQYESGFSLGFNKLQVYFFIIIPLSLRRLLPMSINLFTRIIKSTSVIYLIGGVELIKVGQQVIELSLFKNSYSAFIIYGLILMIYFILCYPLSVYSKFLEKKWS